MNAGNIHTSKYEIWIEFVPYQHEATLLSGYWIRFFSQMASAINWGNDDSLLVWVQIVQISQRWQNVVRSEKKVAQFSTNCSTFSQFHLNISEN